MDCLVQHLAQRLFAMELACTIVGIPQLVAEFVAWVDAPFQREERFGARIGCEELLTAGVDLIRQVVAAPVGDGEVDQLPCPVGHGGALAGRDALAVGERGGTFGESSAGLGVEQNCNLRPCSPACMRCPHDTACIVQEEITAPLS